VERTGAQWIWPQKKKKFDISVMKYSGNKEHKPDRWKESMQKPTYSWNI
jgi:hypothetical protein